MQNLELKHLNQASISQTELTIDALSRIAPSCITEVKDSKTGSIKHAVDFHVLRQLLGDSAVEDAAEAYQFNWVGKQEARREAAKSITKTLRPVPEDSVDWDNTQNIYIEGDNLKALKLLQKSYLGKVKMIYIDPPYNTGNDFVYHDDFKQSQSEYDEAAGNVDEEGNRLVSRGKGNSLDDAFKKNTDSNGRFHSDWCSMIYSRLMIARSLLTEDGVIFISIGVEELTTLKSICDEVFGEKNFIEVFSWVKTSTPPSLAVKSRKTNEYILCYERCKNNIKYNGELLDGGDQPLLNSGNAIAELYFPKDKVYFKNGKFPNGKYPAFCKDRVELLDDIEIKDGYSLSNFRLKGEFKWTQQFLDEEIAKGTTFIIKSDNLSIRFIREGEGYKRPTNFIKEKYTSPIVDKSSCGVGTNENASSQLQDLMDGKNVFSYPKPVSLIKHLTNFVCKENDIVMDFFSGSATTAEAVMSFNDEKETNLKYILVQLQENLDENLKMATDAPTKEIIQNGINFLDKIGKPHKLPELAKERIRRAGTKIKEELEKKQAEKANKEKGLFDGNGNGNGVGENKGAKLDTGFRVFRIDSGNMKDVEQSPSDIKQTELDWFLDNVKDDRTELDLLFGCMLNWGVQLSLPMSMETVDGCNIYTVNEGDLVACLTKDLPVTENIVRAIAEKSPLRVLFRDGSFAADAAKINIFEQFKQLMDWSDDEIIKNVRVL